MTSLKIRLVKYRIGFMQTDDVYDSTCCN